MGTMDEHEAGQIVPIKVAQADDRRSARVRKSFLDTPGVLAEFLLHHWEFGVAYCPVTGIDAREE